jgi:hypothetical protein
MPRKNSHAFEEDENAAVELTKNLSATLEYLLYKSSCSQAKFAPRIGYSRTAFNAVLKGADKGITWRLPMLCAVARVFNIPVYKLIRAAEEPDLREDLARTTFLTTTKPASPERLRQIIGRAINIVPDLLDGDDWEAQYRCSPAEIEAGVPEFYSRYVSGAIGDGEALDILRKANDYRTNNGFCPFWVALRTVFK